MAGQLSPTYAKVVADKALLNAEFGEGPKPDMPYTLGSPEYGDPGHVNTAIEPAPPWVPNERPAPVPVINDPGLLGSSPSLATLNKAAAESYGVEDTDSTSGITEDSNRAEIKDAAVSRLKRLKKEATDSVRAASDTANKGTKLGSASK